MTAIVTGAGGRGCGRAIALRLARDGAAVVVADIDDAGGRETVRLIEGAGGRAAFCHADVRDESQVRQLVDVATTAFDGLSILINNASAPHSTAAGIDGWITSIETDFLGAMHATRHAMEAMRSRGGGSIVNVASISAMWHGRTTPGGFPGYDVAKAALIRLTTALAPSAAQDGIRVNCFAPGWIATDGPRQYWESLTPTQRAERGVPSRLLAPEDVADAVVRLACDPTRNGRIVIWWSEESPRMIRWGDRGYREFEEFC